MNRYGIADVGSNTVVLIVYEVNADQLKQLKYISTPVHLINYVKDGKIFFEIMNDAGRGTGEYEEGKEVKFLTNETMLIDGVTYERYAAHRRRLATEKDAAPVTPDGRIPVKVYK